MQQPGVAAKIADQTEIPSRLISLLARTTLWVASQVGEARDAAFQSARQLGYDLSLVARQT